MKSRKFKEGMYLTDGKNVIRVGYVQEPNWTPSNNYGRKEQLLTNCTTFPKGLAVDGILTVQEKYQNEIPSIWFQEGYHLSHFIGIKKELLSEEILKKLG